ncbi:hypothetical protein E4U33_001406, partial [Claviceps sp. LM78 group G4]
EPSSAGAGTKVPDAAVADNSRLAVATVMSMGKTPQTRTQLMSTPQRYSSRGRLLAQPKETKQLPV